jgi:hypothetical protein
MKPNISKVFECLLGFAIALPNLPIFTFLGLLHFDDQSNQQRESSICIKLHRCLAVIYTVKLSSEILIFSAQFVLVLGIL